MESELVLGRDNFVKVNPERLIVGKEYYIEKKPDRIIGTYRFADEHQFGVTAYFSNVRRPNGKKLRDKEINDYYNRVFYDIKTQKPVNRLIQGNEYYIVNKPEKKIGTYVSTPSYYAVYFTNIKDVNGELISNGSELKMESYIFYEVKKPDIINNFNKRAYEEILSNNLYRVDTRTGKRVRESLDPSVINTLKMFDTDDKAGGRKGKSKRRRSYRRKSRKYKR